MLFFSAGAYGHETVVMLFILILWLISVMLFFSAGAYEHDLKRNKKVQWHQSFGGQPVLMPSIKVRSIIDQNTDKVSMQKQ